jgi:diacylglycerol kinase
MIELIKEVSELPKKVNNYNALKSVQYAFTGIILAFNSEKNLWLQGTIGLIAISISLVQHMIFFVVIHAVCMGMVLSSELTNTAFENLCDLVEPKYSNKVKTIKDVAAGSVLIAALVWLGVIAWQLGIILEYFTFSL